MSESRSQPDLRLELYSRPRFLAAVRSMIGTIAHRVGFSDSEAAQITLALDEALCNIINHGYARQPDGRIVVSIWHLDENLPGIRLMLEDEGRQVDPATIRSRDLEDVRPGGLGVHIIQQSMDEVVYEKREEVGMRLTMVKRVANPQPAIDEEQPDTVVGKGSARHE